MIDFGTRDPDERVRRLRILNEIGFEPICVHERLSRISRACDFECSATPVLVHRDLRLSNDERSARLMTVFSGRHYVLPGFFHLSAFRFWFEHWSDDFMEGGRAQISMTQMRRWGWRRKPEIEWLEAQFSRADRAIAASGRKPVRNLPILRVQAVA